MYSRESSARPVSEQASRRASGRTGKLKNMLLVKSCDGCFLQSDHGQNHDYDHGAGHNHNQADDHSDSVPHWLSAQTSALQWPRFSLHNFPFCCYQHPFGHSFSFSSFSKSSQLFLLLLFSSASCFFVFLFASFLHLFISFLSFSFLS